MKYLLLSFLAFSCGQGSLQFSSSSRNPAQVEENYRACSEIHEELLIEPINLSELPRTFSNLKEHVFKNNCASCHFGASSYLPHLDNYDSTLEYVDQLNPIQSKLLKAITEGRMPPSYRLQTRTPEAVKFVRLWIEEGARP